MAPSAVPVDGFTRTEEEHEHYDRPTKRRKTLTTASTNGSDLEDGDTTLPSHPLGIRPSGNAYTAAYDIRRACGSFARLPDELLITLLEGLDARDLVRLGSACKAFYAFTRLEELWRTLFIE